MHPDARSFQSQAPVFYVAVRHGMRLDWAVVCWALSSLYHDWRTSSSTLSSVEVQLLREDLSTTRTVLADLEEGHLTCGWRLRFSGWILQASLVIHLATLAWCLGHRIRRRTPEAPPLAIAGAGSADSEEGDSSPNTGVSSVSRAPSGGQEPAAALGKGRPIRPSDLRSRHGRLHPQH